MEKTDEDIAFSELIRMHGVDPEGTAYKDDVRLAIAFNRTLQRIEDGTVAPEWRRWWSERVASRAFARWPTCSKEWSLQEGGID